MEMARIEHWDTRTLDEKIDGMLYERTALSRKPEELIKQELKQIQATNSLTPDVVFRSSYFLDTLGLAGQSPITSRKSGCDAKGPLRGVVSPFRAIHARVYNALLKCTTGLYNNRQHRIMQKCTLKIGKH